jgi:hypothetical protein
LISTITVAGQTINLVALPAVANFRSYELYMNDMVAIATAEFTGQAQAQQWPGADSWTGTMEPPSLDVCDAAEWKAFLAQLRGQANAMQIGDPLYTRPRGEPLGMPVCAATPVDLVGSQVLHTQGWEPGKFNLLKRWDYLQLGYRLHAVLDPVNSDGSGDATISIWPSLREAPTASQPIILANPRGLFRLGANKRGWSADYGKFSTLSFPIMEYR